MNKQTEALENLANTLDAKAVEANNAGIPLDEDGWAVAFAKSSAYQDAANLVRKSIVWESMDEIGQDVAKASAETVNSIGAFLDAMNAEYNRSDEIHAIMQEAVAKKMGAGA